MPYGAAIARLLSKLVALGGEAGPVPVLGSGVWRLAEVTPLLMTLALVRIAAGAECRSLVRLRWFGLEESQHSGCSQRLDVGEIPDLLAGFPLYGVLTYGCSVLDKL